MIEMANGQMPAPISSPTAPLSRPKSVPNRVLHRYRRLKNANEVVTRAMKQPQKTTLSLVV